MKIGLVGTFDVENFGDCMFPELYATLLRSRFADAEIALYSPLPHAAEILSFDRVHALPDHERRASLATLDADTLILIGGETVGHGHSAGTFNFPRATLSAYLRLWLAPILAARHADLRPQFFAAHCVGARKMPAEINRAVAACMAAADRVRFRDTFSAEWIVDQDTSFGVDIDPMFLIDRVCTRDDWHARAAAHLPDGIAPEGYLAAQVSLGYGGNDLNAWVAAVQKIAAAQDLPVVLVPICHFMEDERLLAQLEAMLQARGVTAHLVRGQLNVKDTAALVGMAAGYVGSSLHGAVTSVAFGRPMAVLGHSPDGKHAGTLRAVGVTGVVATTSADLPGCFAHSTTLDQAADRSHAQALAQASIDGLMDAIAASASEAQTQGLEAAAATLITAERSSPPVAEAKRLVLRTVRATPGLSELHRRWRLWKVFRDV